MELFFNLKIEGHECSGQKKKPGFILSAKLFITDKHLHKHWLAEWMAVNGKNVENNEAK